MLEEDMQATLMEWFAWQYPAYDPLFWHTPNGGKRHIGVAVKLKRQGVKPGVPDNFLAVPRGAYHGFFLELKSDKGKLSEKQSVKIDLLKAQGYAVAIEWTIEGAQKSINNYLKG